jgi:hypothetical protein
VEEEKIKLGKPGGFFKKPPPCPLKNFCLLREFKSSTKKMSDFHSLRRRPPHSGVLHSSTDSYTIVSLKFNLNLNQKEKGINYGCGLSNRI